MGAALLQAAWIGLSISLLLLFVLSLLRPKSTLRSPSHCKSDAFSFAFQAKNGCLPLNNPRRGTLVVGMAGSGKTKSVIEPALLRFLQKGYCGILYGDCLKTPIQEVN